jgi:hypothetical protein
LEKSSNFGNYKTGKKKALNKGFGIALPVPSYSSFKSSTVRI